jgi:hypothetical protein
MAIEGIHCMVSPSKMIQPAKRMRDFYAMKPGAGIIQREFGFYSLDRWKDEGHISESTNLNDLFTYEKPGSRSLHDLGWVTAAFCPMFDTSVLEDRGDYEVIRDNAGRHVLVFKGRRDGFMPEYLDHPVKDMRS